MALVASEEQQHAVVDKSDITRNLPSLQFESALEEGEGSYLALRTRSHAISVAMCAQATYLCCILNEAREIVAELRNPGQRQTQKFLLEGQGQDPLQIGIIGCGRLGAQLANCLLTYGEIKPSDLKISTRRPETLGDLRERGVQCVFDNSAVASCSHVIFLCILPAQLNNVVEDLKYHLPPTTLLYSFINSVPVSRIRQLLSTTQIIKPEFKWPLKPGRKGWDCSKDILSVFEDEDMIMQTCPISDNKEFNVVWTESFWASDVIMAFMNMCTCLELTGEESLDVLHAVVFGQATHETLADHVTATDFEQENDSMLFPLFELSSAQHHNSLLLQQLTDSRVLTCAFRNKYSMLFQRFTQWKNRSST